MEKIKITMDNYNSYVELYKSLYKIKKNISDYEDKHTKKYLRNSVKIFCSGLLLSIATMLLFPASLLVFLVVNIELLVMALAELVFNFSYFKKIYDFKKENINKVKEMYSDIETDFIDTKLNIDKIEDALIATKFSMYEPEDDKYVENINKTTYNQGIITDELMSEENKKIDIFKVKKIGPLTKK